MNVYDHAFLLPSKGEKDMHDFQDKTVLIVNTASESEFTNQYKDLELFYRKYKDKGFEIVAFPCGQFKQGEPNGTEYHLNFCKENFDITFTIALKSWVNGDDAVSLFKYLKQEGKDNQEVSDNFEKFLILKGGKILNFNSETTIWDIEDVILKDLGEL